MTLNILNGKEAVALGNSFSEAGLGVGDISVSAKGLVMSILSHEKEWHSLRCRTGHETSH